MTSGIGQLASLPTPIVRFGLTCVDITGKWIRLGLPTAFLDFLLHLVSLFPTSFLPDVNTHLFEVFRTTV